MAGGLQSGKRFYYHPSRRLAAVPAGRGQSTPSVARWDGQVHPAISRAGRQPVGFKAIAIDSAGKRRPAPTDLADPRHFPRPPPVGLRHVPHLALPAAARTYCIPASLDSGTTPPPPLNVTTTTPPATSLPSGQAATRFPPTTVDTPPFAQRHPLPQSPTGQISQRPPRALPRPARAKKTQWKRGGSIGGGRRWRRRPPQRGARPNSAPPLPRHRRATHHPRCSSLSSRAPLGTAAPRRRPPLAHGRMPDHHDRRRPVAGRGMRRGWPLPNCIDEACQAWARLV